MNRGNTIGLVNDAMPNWKECFILREKGTGITVISPAAVCEEMFVLFPCHRRSFYMGHVPDAEEVSDAYMVRNLSMLDCFPGYTGKSRFCLEIIAGRPFRNHLACLYEKRNTFSYRFDAGSSLSACCGNVRRTNWIWGWNGIAADGYVLRLAEEQLLCVWGDAWGGLVGNWQRML